MKSSLIGILTAVLAAGAQSNEAERLLKAAINVELVNGDLMVAIEQYRDIVAKHKKDRKVAALALVHMAECYQKLGDTESRKLYEKVLRDYADQKEAVATARARLGKEPGTIDSRLSFREVWKLPEEGSVSGTISRDGRYFPYVDWSQNGNLFLHDFSTGTDRRLTATATDRLPDPKIEQFALDTSFSRDARLLAYSWFRGDTNRFELRLMDLKGDGIPQSRLLFDNADVSYVAPTDWSPDGKSIAVRITRADKTGQIGLVSVPDGALRVMKSVDWRGPTMLIFSPDGNYLAYDVLSDDKTGKRDIFVLAADGSREIPAVVSPSHDTVVGWSNDGKRLLFASDRSGPVGLWSVPFTGGKVEGPPELVRHDIGNVASLGLTDGAKLYAGVNASGVKIHSDIYLSAIDFATGKLLSPPTLAAQAYVGSNLSPSWSPNGNYLAYASVRGSVTSRHFVIAVRSMETGEVREIFPSPALDADVSGLQWAPDALSFLIRGRDTKGRYGIFRIDAQTGRSSILVTQGDREVVALLGSSPDGKKVYYASRRFEGGNTVITQNQVRIEKDLTTGSEKELFRTFRRGPEQLSPDGRYLAGTGYLASAGVGSPGLFIFATGGGKPRELAAGTGMRQLRGFGWAADSSAVYAITETGEIWRLPVDGGEPRKLDLKMERNYPDMRGFRMHPDGQRIAFEARPPKPPTEVWVLENFLPKTTVASK